MTKLSLALSILLSTVWVGASSAIELTAGQRFCLSDASFQCETLFDIKSIDDSSDQVNVIHYKRAFVPINEDLPVTKWHFAKKKMEFLVTVESAFEIVGYGGVQPSKITMCRKEVVDVTFDVLSRPSREQANMLESIPAMREKLLERLNQEQACMEISTCSVHTSILPREEFFSRLFIDNKEVVEGRSFLRFVNSNKAARDIVQPYPLLFGNPFYQPPDCYVP